MDELFGDINELWLDIVPENDNTIQVQDVYENTDIDDSEMKDKALRDSRNALSNHWIDIDYLVEGMKDIAENAMTVTKQWDVIEDYPSRLAALKQLKSVRREANKIDKKDPVVLTFKPIFDKPPKLL